MKPLVVTISEFSPLENIVNNPAHSFLKLALAQGAEVKGLLLKQDSAADTIYDEGAIRYFVVNNTKAFVPTSVDMPIPEYVQAYLSMLAPDVIVIQTLSKALVPWLIGAAEQKIPVVLDLALIESPEQLFKGRVESLLVNYVHQIWVANAKQRQALMALKISGSKLVAIKVKSNQEGYLADSTAELWPLLRLRAGIAESPAQDVAFMPLKHLRIAAIMDEFTRGCFDPEATIHHLTAEYVVEQLIAFKPQLFFIESAWKGINDSWKLQVSNRGEALMQAVSWCRLHKVPIVFWNKEDPVHFATFLPTAATADWVFTTDIDCIPRYKAALGHNRVGLLPFAAQTAVHNPLELYNRKDAFNFAGSYYLRYPQRQQDFNTLIDVVSGLKDVDIYDRNANNPHPNYMFPERYKKLILGALPFSEIDKAYKGYRYGINMNTIKQSQSMFARRVFELLASNTVVVSNYSRGVRNFFGNLVICSDNADEIKKQLQPIVASDNYYQRFRLAGLRKVLSSHTYQHRLAEIVKCVFGTKVTSHEPEVLVVAVARNEQEQAAIIENYQRQRYKQKRLLLVQLQPNPEAVVLKSVTTVASLQEALSITNTTKVPYTACFAANDFYGEHYLTDLMLSWQYNRAQCVTKARYYQLENNVITLAEKAPCYQYVQAVRLSASVFVSDKLSTENIAAWMTQADFCLTIDSALAIDPFNYCRAAAYLTSKDLAEITDLHFADLGQRLDAELLPLAGKLPEKKASVAYDASADLMMLSANKIASHIDFPLTAGVSHVLEMDTLQLRSELAPSMHKYVYLRNRFNRADLNLVTNSQFQLVVAHHQGDIRTVFEYYAADGKRLGHSINRAPGEKHSLAIPEECSTVRVGVRLQGRASVVINKLVLGAIPETAEVVTAKASTLVLTKQYPAYDDLYKYGFLHSRVRAYREEGIAVDVFRVKPGHGQVFREFEDIDVTEGNYTLLDQTLASGQYKHVLVHFLDSKKWEVLAKHLDKIKVTVWVHGAEIQVWQRREYEFERMSEAEIVRQKKLSDARIKFWRSVLAPVHPNLKLVFVSDYFAKESFADIGVQVPESSYHIIHNYIDTNLFNYQPKKAEQRLRLLSIRPYASRKYANDITIDAIKLLSTKSFFAELDICLVGDGELFDELTAPLIPFSNVKLVKSFM